MDDIRALKEGEYLMDAECTLRFLDANSGEVIEQVLGFKIFKDMPYQRVKHMLQKLMRYHHMALNDSRKKLLPELASLLDEDNDMTKILDSETLNNLIKKSHNG